MCDRPLLDIEQCRRLVLNLGKLRGPRGFTDEDMQLLLDKANEAYVGWILFETAIRNLVRIDVRNGEVIFLHPEGESAYQRRNGYLETSTTNGS